jgi:hypothetical protein
MSVSGSGSWVNDSRLREHIFSRAFLRGVLRNTGVLRGLLLDNMWSLAGKNVVNEQSFCGV